MKRFEFATGREQYDGKRFWCAWLDTDGNETDIPGKRPDLLKYASENGWDLVAVDEGSFFFKRAYPSS